MSNVTDGEAGGVREVRTPDREGWWARIRDGRVAWFRVDAVTDSPKEHGGDAVGYDPDCGSCQGGVPHPHGGGELEVRLVVYVDAVERFLPLAHFCSPLARWYGPVRLPCVEDE